MKSLVLENEALIEKFDINFYLDTKNYPIASALSALETTNEIQKSFFDVKENLDLSDHILRLYALLQGLFVSVDSLYALAYSLTKSKNFININLNPTLRELKYIRNDVVGHPASRVYDSSRLAYCILDNSSINAQCFEYKIYSKDDVTTRKIDIESLVRAYYNECNNYLDEIYNVAIESKNRSELEDFASKCLDVYQLDGDFKSALAELKQEYLNIYPNSNSSQHRVLWRIELIEKLLRYNSDDDDVKDLVKYSIGIQFIKILELITNTKYGVSLNIRTPYLLSSFYRFFNRNSHMVFHINNIYDIKNPSFKNSLNEILSLAYSKNIKGVIKYANLLLKLYDEKEDGLVYSLALPLTEFKKKR